MHSFFHRHQGESVDPASPGKELLPNTHRTQRRAVLVLDGIELFFYIVAGMELL